MGKSRILIYVCSMFSPFLASIVAHGQSTQIFAIGTKDGSFKEFIHNRESDKATIYRVGESTADRDWYAYQPGPLDSSVGRSTMQRDWMTVKPPASDPSLTPFQVIFKLPSSPKGTFILHLDAIFRYRRPAPPRYAVSINGKPAASYQLSPHPSPDIWWSNYCRCWYWMRRIK